MRETNRQPEQRPSDGAARQGADAMAPHAGAPRSSGRILIVSSDDRWLECVESTLLESDVNCEAVRTAAMARRALDSDGDDPRDGQYDIVLVDAQLPDGDGVDLIEAAAQRGLGAILASRDEGRLDDAVRAMRSGALDYVVGKITPNELMCRVRSAMDRARAAREKEHRVVKLKRACRRLKSDRRRAVRQVDSLCTDLVQAYQELADQMNQVTIAAEFSSLIRQELDIESLLRTTLEFILARSGPTNAAIFLPTTSGDFSLGAYVNYDCPKETCDILLDHLANSVAPRFEGQVQVAHLRTADDFDHYIGDDADWLADSEVLGVSCEHEDECLAIVMLFRDQRSPFQEQFSQQFGTIGSLFADQLARVIKIHHRHLPKHKWGALGDPEQGEGGDYGDLAA